jgi:hypothetical protein
MKRYLNVLCIHAFFVYNIYSWLTTWSLSLDIVKRWLWKCSHQYCYLTDLEVQETGRGEVEIKCLQLVGPQSPPHTGQVLPTALTAQWVLEERASRVEHLFPA